MGCRLRIFLTQEEKATLNELRKATLVPQRTKDRAFVLLLNARGWKNAQIGEQKRLEQTARRGRRLSILGLWSPRVSFEYGLAIGSFTSETYIKVMDWQAERARLHLADTGQITVVVQDNGSLHTSGVVQTKWLEWQEKGLYLFFLPKYCSEMNLLESEWHQLKTHELAGQMFEDEYDLALAVMEGVKVRGEQKGYSTERFKFNSA